MDIYDIAVIGAGAAGSMAAISAGNSGKKIVLIEKNSSLGKKILITGKGRCNITNTASIDSFIEEFDKAGPFLRRAFFKFFNHDLIDFFEKNGLKMKTERQGRVFPVTDRADSVIGVLEKALKESKVKMIYRANVTTVKKEKDVFVLKIDSNEKIFAKKVILTTGGLSFKETGSTGDGFRIAKRLGHNITSLKSALVPLKTEEKWVKDLQGLSLRNVSITIKYGKKKLKSSVGELMFAHFGLSGPLILDLSGKILSFLEKHKKISIFIDLKPGLDLEKLNNKLLREFKEKGTTKLKNLLKDLLPGRLIDVFLYLASLDPDKECSQVTQKERQSMVSFLKEMPLKIIGSLPVDKAMVTSGGISTKEINPRTMESKIISGLYFAGEIIDGSAKSGGYNLQQAFSTGYLAGEEASKCVK